MLDKGDVAYLHGGYDNIFAKVEAALEGKTVGDTLTIDLSVDDAFGPHDPSLQRTIPKGEISSRREGGRPAARHRRPRSAPDLQRGEDQGPVVLLDGNHPLAGKALRFSCKVAALRAASEEEIAHRHVHGGQRPPPLSPANAALVHRQLRWVVPWLEHRSHAVSPLSQLPTCVPGPGSGGTALRKGCCVSAPATTASGQFYCW